jgi:polar amino acid transport system ATP-binding protein
MMTDSLHPAVSIANLRKSFNNVPVLQGIDLNVAGHELTVLIGPSGCGKSTLLRCLNLLEIFDEGKIQIAGMSMEREGGPVSKDFHTQARALRKMVGMVFQSFNLFPHLTVLQNVTCAPQVVKKIAKEEAEATARDLLNKVGLGSHLHHYPLQLSGGQLQRAAIARSLALAPKVMLYDEPTSALDPGLVDEVLNVMKALHDEGMTQIVVTHEMRFAREVADKIAYVDQGRVVEVAPPEKMFSAPEDEKTRRFLKKYL